MRSLAVTIDNGTKGMPTFTYKHIQMVMQSPTITHSRHRSRDQPSHRYTAHTNVAPLRLRHFNRHRRYLPPVAGCDGRRGSGSKRQSMEAALETCCGRDRQHPAATRRKACRRARISASLAGATTRQQCAAHAPPQRRRQRRCGTQRPLNRQRAKYPTTLTRESAFGFPHGVFMWSDRCSDPT